MFTGAIPKELIVQLLEAVPWPSWGAVHVCCSGSFRPEMALKARFPDLRVVGNDVSLLSVAIGKLAAGEALEFRFCGRLSDIERRLDGADQTDRVAAVLVANEMAAHRGSNAHAEAVFAHYLANFPKFLVQARKKVEGICQKLPRYEFFAGDFRAHAAHGIDQDAGIWSFLPTYKKGYETLYKFLDENISWSPPGYQIWDPANLEDWLIEIERQGARYCAIADHRLDQFEPAIRYDGEGGRKTLYAFIDQGRSSLRGKTAVVTPFEYRAVDPSAVGSESVVQIVAAQVGHLTFLKNRYLARGIRHTAGDLNFLVYLDGMLVGGFIYSRDKFGAQGSVYLLSDFAITSERRLSKLVAMLATSRLAVTVARKRFLADLRSIETTAFTDRPVSMKYRGIFELKARKPGQLQYRSSIRDGSPQDIYREWFRRWGGEQPRASGDAGPPGANLAA